MRVCVGTSCTQVYARVYVYVTRDTRAARTRYHPLQKQSVRRTPADHAADRIDECRGFSHSWIVIFCMINEAPNMRKLTRIIVEMMVSFEAAFSTLITLNYYDFADLPLDMKVNILITKIHPPVVVF